MTYTAYSVGTWQEARQRIRQFAQSLGWTTGDYTDDNGNFWEWFTLPGGPDIEIRYRDDFPVSWFEGLFVRVRNDTPVKLGSSICSPLIGDWDNPQKPALSTLHCFGAGDPETPWLAAVIEFADGFFRHIYMGRLHKYGTYDGGTVITSSNWHVGDVWNASGWDFFGERFRRPFSAHCIEDIRVGQEAGYVGGVHIGTTARNFEWSGGYGDWWARYGRPACLGGVGDGVLDHFVSTGNAGTGAIAPMWAINLYAIENAGTPDSYLVPVGRPVGIRYVNMKFINPTQVLYVGGDAWRVFPVFKLNRSSWLADSPDRMHWADETSYIIGLAYKE